MKDILPLKEAIYEMGLYFNQQPGDDRITAYAKALSNYTPQQIVYAFKQVINSGSAFFPSLAEILKHLRPAEDSTEDKAAIVTEEIIRYAQAYGYMQIEKAFYAISEDARIAAGSPSFLLEVCNTPFDDLTTLKAQIRRQAKAAFERTVNTAKNEKLQAIGIETGKVLTLRKPEFAEFLPSSPA